MDKVFLVGINISDNKIINLKDPDIDSDAANRGFVLRSIKNPTITIEGGEGLSGSSSFTLNQPNDQTITLSAGDPVDITWNDLVAKLDRKAGQRFNITTSAPGTVTYGIVVLVTDTTFNYWDGLFELSVKVQ